MTQYQFTALDPSGNEKRGTIEAGSQQEAYAAIQSHGLQPTNVFAVNQPRDVASGAIGLRRPSSAMGTVTLILSVIAILIALAALTWHFFRGSSNADALGKGLRSSNADALGKGLQAYDFSTPREALSSLLKIEANLDVLAQIELEKKRRSPDLEEKIRTLEVRKQETWKEMTILFISFERKGVKRYETQGFEKDAKTGKWMPKYASTSEIQKQDPELARRMNDWQLSGK